MGPLPDRPSMREDRERSLDNAPHTALASSQLLIATSLSECRKQIMKCMQYEQMNFPQLAASCGPSTIDQPRLLMSVGASRWWAVGLGQGPVLPALSQLLQYSVFWCVLETVCAPPNLSQTGLQNDSKALHSC